MFYLLIPFLLTKCYALEVPCSKAFCDEFVAKNPCPKLSKVCSVSHSSNDALDLPYTGPCNCCPYCLDYLKLGDDCPVGEQTSIVPVSLCGPGLRCLANSVTHEKKCELMTTSCAKAQQDYDAAVEAGTIGNLQLRPTCDARGSYAPNKCIPGQICYCVDEEGERIFGEMPYSVLAPIIMQCGCSRHNAKSNKLLNSEPNTWSQMRCLADGSFDPIQCINDQCLCVDKLDGQPTFNEEKLINYTDITENSLDCYDEAIHEETDYYHSCEGPYRRQYTANRKYIDNGFQVFGAVYPKCQMDGYFASIQEDNDKVFCAFPNGTLIEDYELTKEKKNEKLIKDMTCNCARANAITPILDRAHCTKNGNYEEMQCRNGECRCVDPYNGNQVEKEVDYEFRKDLSCWSA